MTSWFDPIGPSWGVLRTVLFILGADIARDKSVPVEATLDTRAAPTALLRTAGVRAFPPDYLADRSSYTVVFSKVCIKSASARFLPAYQSPCRGGMGRCFVVTV